MNTRDACVNHELSYMKLRVRTFFPPPPFPAGTIIVSGYGKGVVVGTGDNTVMGQIANLASNTAPKESLISKDISRFITIISAIAISLGALFVILGITLKTHTPTQAIVLGIAVIVATVPEGLLVTLTVSLALTAKRMHAVNVLVKNTQSVETLGSTSLIASDKTGTLTQVRCGSKRHGKDCNMQFKAQGRLQYAVQGLGKTAM